MAAYQQPRKTITAKEKGVIIELFKNNSCTLEDLVKRYNVTKPTLKKILAGEKKLKKLKGSSKLSQDKLGSNQDLIDEEVTTWYRSMEEKNISVNGPKIKKHAVEIARSMNNITFVASNGWLWRWQKKNNVKFNKVQKNAEQTSNGQNISSTLNESTNVEPSYGQEDTNAFIGSTPFSTLGENMIVHIPSPRSHILMSMSNETGTTNNELQVKNEALEDVQRNLFEADVILNFDASRQNNNESSINCNPKRTRDDQNETSIDRDSGQQNDTNSQIDSDEGSRNVAKRKETQDVYSIYGNYIASRLRESAKTRNKSEVYCAQHSIDDILFKLSMGYYSRNQTSMFNENLGSENGGEEIKRSNNEGV